MLKIELLGEAARHIPEEVRARAPQIAYGEHPARWIVYVRFVGTHAQYDRIDAQDV